MALEGVYCNSIFNYSRLKTSVVDIGGVPLGGNNPIRVQSMTTTDTMDTIATVEQSIRMIEAGCEYVRITAPSIKEAQNLANIKKELRARGYQTPLVADIHFTPNAAELAARIVEKVRVNPGNYADKKKFETIDYTDSEYEAELERIRSRFTPLVKICKEHGTAMRIGTNHGSLSDRIMSRYGDSPLGMVESALEFLRICRENNFHQLVLSMKSSNPQVMVQAYRLLIKKMDEEGMNYPLHLGVTEAGDGEDGRIKSAAGIGTLLEDGIGDTVRVSLTEDPEFEIPVAKALVQRYTNRAAHKPISEVNTKSYDPFDFRKRSSKTVINVGGKNVPRVFADYSSIENIKASDLNPVGYTYSEKLDKWNLSDQACDFIYTGTNKVDFEIPGTLGIVMDLAEWKKDPMKQRTYPLLTAREYIELGQASTPKFVLADTTALSELIPVLLKDERAILVIQSTNDHGMPDIRASFLKLAETGCDVPVIVRRDYNEQRDNALLYSSTDIGGLLLDGFGDGVWLNASTDKQQLNSISFGILQACRARISKTEYISCPSCGRTLFDLQETTAKIRAKTDHLKGVKIGIMGCIVNGPGEMADADYGYVGTGVGKITLYKGREVVERNIDSEKAVDALIDLIKKHGDWVDRSE